MKAEERHELESNTLAATLTKAVSTAKTTETTQWIYATVIVLVVFLVGFLVMRYFATRAAEAAQNWVEVNDGSGKILQRIARDTPTSVPGKVARLQSAWVRFWDFGLKKIMVDPNGAKAQYEYDWWGRRVREIDPNGEQLLTTFDNSGRITSTVNPLGQAVRFQYDGMGNVVSITRPDGVTILREWGAQLALSAQARGRERAPRPLQP